MPSILSIFGDQLQSIDPTAAAAIAASESAHPSKNEGGGSSVLGTGLVGIASNIMGGPCQMGTNNSNNASSAAISGDKMVTATGNIFEELDIKTEVPSAVGVSSTSPCKDSKTGIGGDLFTVEGLNPSPNDLEQLFETSSNDECGSVQIHTPPDSNNPSNGCAVTTNTIDELKRSTNSGLAGTVNVQGNSAVIAALHNCNSGTVASSTTSSIGSLNNSGGSMTGGGIGSGSGANTIQAEDLTKMFPTPPSHEQHHPNSSPCQMDIQMTDLNVITSTSILGQTLDTGLGISSTISKMKQEYSVELGSPMEEPIEDWTYVYRPPAQAKFVGSSKYAPLTNLPSQSMAPLVIPSNCRYKPSWQQPRNTHQQQVSDKTNFILQLHNKMSN